MSFRHQSGGVVPEMDSNFVRNRGISAGLAFDSSQTAWMAMVSSVLSASDDNTLGSNGSNKACKCIEADRMFDSDTFSGHT